MPVKQYNLTVIAGCIGLVVIIACVLAFAKSPSEALSRDDHLANGVVFFNEAREIFPFQLVDSHDQEINNTLFNNHWTLLFFGFTHCPHVCPTTLVELNKLFKALPPKIQSSLQVMLVTVDPKRDTPERLLSYLSSFNLEFLGATGSKSELTKFKQNFNVMSHQVETDYGYSIDHSSHILLVNPKGEYIGFMQQPLKLRSVIQSLESYLNAF